MYFQNISSFWFIFHPFQSSFSLRLHKIKSVYLKIIASLWNNATNHKAKFNKEVFVRKLLLLTGVKKDPVATAKYSSSNSYLYMSWSICYHTKKPIDSRYIFTTNKYVTKHNYWCLCQNIWQAGALCLFRVFLNDLPWVFQIS